MQDEKHKKLYERILEKKEGIIHLNEIIHKYASERKWTNEDMLIFFASSSSSCIYGAPTKSARYMSKLLFEELMNMFILMDPKEENE